jgi:hypothetical protein
MRSEENERLTRTGAPAGERMRRYWQPAALSGDRPLVAARVPCEDLVLFREAVAQVERGETPAMVLSEEAAARPCRAGRHRAGRRRGRALGRGHRTPPSGEPVGRGGHRGHGVT